MKRYDCTSCGACCVATLDYNGTYVDMEPKERDALPKHKRRLTVLARGFQVYSVKTKKDRDGHNVCGFLVGRVGIKVRCSVYADRPRVCSSFRVGSAECRGSRYELELPT